MEIPSEVLQDRDLQELETAQDLPGSGIVRVRLETEKKRIK